jgi:hypothetical protein
VAHLQSPAVARELLVALTRPLRSPPVRIEGLDAELAESGPDVMVTDPAAVLTLAASPVGAARYDDLVVVGDGRAS